MPVLVNGLLIAPSFAQEVSAPIITGELRASLPIEPFIVNSFYGDRTHPVTGQKNTFHAGIDLWARSLTVMAVLPGMVKQVSWNPIFGNYIAVAHGKFTTFYGHLSSFCVAKGNYVCAGQPLGRTGNTGRTTGEHLHFSVQCDGQRINPLQFLATILPLSGQELFNYLTNDLWIYTH